MTESKLKVSKKSLFRRRGDDDKSEQRKEIMDKIKNYYLVHDKYQLTRVEHKNIMLIGRTPTGKSTIKSMLIDPTVVLNNPLSNVGRRESLFESLHIGDNQIVLNIIDTPGLFERSVSEISVQDTETILHTFERCVNREITKLHVVCFCIPITCGINDEDIQLLKLLVKFFGNDIRENSCLIITRCECIDEYQRTNIRADLLADGNFREIAPFFQLGVFFSGSLNSDDYFAANYSLLEQFVAITDYRTRLIELFTSEIDPFPISDMAINQIRRARDDELLNDAEFQPINAHAQEQVHIVDRLLAINLRERLEHTHIVKN